MTTGSQMRISTFNCMIHKPMKSFTVKTPRLELLLLMMISQDKLLSRNPRPSKLLHQRKLPMLLLLERMDQMAKSKLIMRPYSLMTPLTLLLQELIIPQQRIPLYSLTEKLARLLKLKFWTEKMKKLETSPSVFNFLTANQLELSSLRSLSKSLTS
jgi:hypothetical protein